MPSNELYKLRLRKKSSGRSSTTTQSDRSSRCTSTSHASRRSSSRSTSTVTAGLGRPQVHIHSPCRNNGGTLQASSDSLPRNSRPKANNDENEDALNEIIMAVDLRERGTVGCCYYVARDEKLYFMEDVQLGGLDVVDACRLCPPSRALSKLIDAQ